MGNSPILVNIFLRGGCDGLNLVAPSADPVYISERRTECRVEREGDNKGLPLENNFADYDFRLHFKAGKLKELYDQKHLALVHACGLTNGTRSHFEAVDYMERGTPENKNTPTGWLTRLASAADHTGLKLPVVAASQTLPISLLACNGAIAIPDARKIQLKGNPLYRNIQENIVRNLYKNSNNAVARNAFTVLECIDTISSRIPRDPAGKFMDYVPTKGVTYPTDNYAKELNHSLATLAQLVKMDLGVQFATVDFGGWDTHIGQGGRFSNLVDALSRGIGAFWDDMAAYHDRLVIVVMSEFGRRLKSNDSGGTDHGHGNIMMVLGGQVKGGAIYGKWPGLANENLDNQVDLAVTTDYRQVLGEIVTTQFGASSLNTVFPKFTLSKKLGIMI